MARILQTFSMNHVHHPLTCIQTCTLCHTASQNTRKCINTHTYSHIPLHNSTPHTHTNKLSSINPTTYTQMLPTSIPRTYKHNHTFIHTITRTDLHTTNQHALTQSTSRPTTNTHTHTLKPTKHAVLCCVVPYVCGVRCCAQLVLCCAVLCCAVACRAVP
jgi:hypothetical protein